MRCAQWDVLDGRGEARATTAGATVSSAAGGGSAGEWDGSACELPAGERAELGVAQWEMSELRRPKVSLRHETVSCLCAAARDTALLVAWHDRWLPRSNLYLVDDAIDVDA